MGTRLPLVVAVAIMVLGMPMAVVLPVAGTVGLTQTGVAAVMVVVRVQALVLNADLVTKLTS